MLFLFSCNSKNNEPVKPAEAEATEAGFFPVTDFIKGQIYEYKDRGITPIQYIYSDNKKDSSWLSQDSLLKVISPFLEPVIDSANMKDKFKETKFLDLSLNALTLSYDPKDALAEDFPLRRWDVYINPETNQVSRVYLIKKQDGKMLQLTWLPRKSCKMVWINNGEPASVEKEIWIKWEFNEE